MEPEIDLYGGDVVIQRIELDVKALTSARRRNSYAARTDTDQRYALYLVVMTVDIVDMRVTRTSEETACCKLSSQAGTVRTVRISAWEEIVLLAGAFFVVARDEGRLAVR